MPSPPIEGHSGISTAFGTKKLISAALKQAPQPRYNQIQKKLILLVKEENNNIVVKTILCCIQLSNKDHPEVSAALE